MIRLNTIEYYIEGVSEDSFWKRLDSITVGQEINPEFSYTTQYLGKFENVFGGRKRGNEFAIYLYRSVSQMFRTEILSKGKVKQSKNGLKIICNYEIPFWSILMFLVLSTIIILPFFTVSIVVGTILMMIGLGIYSLIVRSNYNNVKSEVQKQFDLMKTNAEMQVDDVSS